MADLEWKGLTLIERRDRPDDSPIWDGSDGEPEGVRMLIAANLVVQPEIYSTIVRTEGGPGATAEATTFGAANSQACTNYASRQNTGPRLRDIQASDRAKVAAVRQRPDTPREGAGGVD